MFDLDAYLNRMARAIEPMMGDIAEPCTSKLQGDARELAQRIDKLPLYLASGDTRLAALEGIEIGWLSERIHARQFEPKVIQATKTRKGLASRRTKKATKTESRRNDIRNWVAKRLKQYPKDTLTYARKLAATKLAFRSGP